jgi:hypothetical protein
MTTAALLRARLQLIYDWYGRMVNPATGTLEYLYIPEEDAFVRERSPIRDIASVWDLELLGELLKRQELRPVIDRSLAHYAGYLIARDGYLILDPGQLQEPSSIAHSAFTILALLHAPPPRRMDQIGALAEGILRQQRADGSYRVYFHDLPDEGEELYAGEAMLALLEAYRQLNETRYLRSAEEGVSYYDAQYFRQGRVTDDGLVFFANWQSQACRLLFEHSESAAVRAQVSAYVWLMHDTVIERGFFRRVDRRPDEQVSVEVACALEGLGAAYALARTSSDMRVGGYGRCLCIGLAYLLALQCTGGGTARERGGFGLSRSERMQRIDVTGHAASAFLRSLENGIECPGLGS